ncbi:MAG: thioesterase [Rhodocyclales bacterium CG17_big_fil_post_rev_8_21_14_2_50_68_7]|nr:MAG: thioesterase [Betaproteobacteria bacterium CG2_30_68_42]PIV76913.1 MAG: thioesterase [Rhodocyclales bacterium CG17_big_fil_post_rev_8_21_14_2_50_68_7]PIX76252.1 MAG: thioesterase [Rhodocyclales bacterium CG_4_10_14_3_um_filter_68_10]PJA56193.1 MAG: thioesterase [Rhodocyclales bacterium CG_4_9_14_3_um_filter_68_10]
MTPATPRSPGGFQPSDPDYAERVRASFGRQKVMAFLGAELTGIGPGWCEIRLPYREELTQQHGYFQAGIVGAIVDNAGGYAGYSLMPADASVLTVEYKLNLLAPADGELLLARGEVIKPGRTLVITRGEVHVFRDGRMIHCASMQQTLMTLHGRPDRPAAGRKEKGS